MSTIVTRQGKGLPLTNSELDANFLNLNADKLEASALTPYLTSATAASTYQPIGSYLTGITSGQVTTALGFTPYNATNPAGYITSSALSPYLLSATASSTYLPLAGGTMSGNVTLNGGTANGVAYLNGSKVLTTGSALTFDGTTLYTSAVVLQGNTTNFGGYSFQAGNQNGFAIRNAANSGLAAYFGAGGSSALSTSGNYAVVSGTDGIIFGRGVNEDMRLTSTGLGIGTSSPSAKLDVQGGNLINGNGTIKTGFSYDTNGLMGTLSNHSLGVLVNSTVIARFDTSGNLGLGVTPSGNYTLQSASNYASASGFKGFSLGSFAGGAAGNGFPWVGYNIRPNVTTADSYSYNLTDVATAIKFDSGIKFYTAPSGTAGNAISFTQAMTLDASGNLGIGITSPIAKLDVLGGNARVALGGGSGSTLRGYEIASGGSVFASLKAEATTGELRLEAGFSGFGGYSTFYTNGSERARIDASGNLLVGTTTPEGKLTVSGNGVFRNYSGADYQLAALSPSGADRQVFQAGVVGISNGLTVRYVSGAMQYTLTGLGTGTVSSSGGVLSASSDQNMKVADGEVTSAIEKVQQLQPRYFYWKDTNGNANEDAGRQLGFFAQEVNAVLPEAAPEPKGKDEGWGVYDRSLVAVLTAAIQELKAEFDAYKATHP